MTIHVYGIPNCDTVKKARRWFDERAVSYVFHDFKKEGLALETLSRWEKSLGWETLINRKGTTWRQLPDAKKNVTDSSAARSLMLENLSLIKRPVVETAHGLSVGFDESRFEQILLSYT